MTRGRLALVPLAAILLLGDLVLPAKAEAQVFQSEHEREGSPQHFAIELRFGPYKPDIDSEFAGTNALGKDRTPYKDFFGTNRRLMTQVEFDYEIIRHVGTAALGFAFGYFKETGHNLLGNGSGSSTPDTSTLRLLPFSLSAIYRFDLAYERYKIPLVPYGKLGLDYVFWTVNNGNGQVPSDPTGGSGQGGTLGWHAAVGLSLVLDVFDQNTANQFDEEMGINHTHLFYEYGHIDMSGLGEKDRLHVGDNTWTAGMMFEF